MAMFRATYPDGGLSADHYNLARAKNHTAVLAETEGRKDRRQRSPIAPYRRHSRRPVPGLVQVSSAP